VNETVRDVKFLHNFQLFAVAQKKYVYIYDSKGLETHALKHQQAVTRLDYLPYHWLLTSISSLGMLRYQDTSTGQLVAEIKTTPGHCKAMAQNPANAIIHLGHSNGVVTMWSPNVQKPLVSMLCHKGPVQAVAVNAPGNTMVTSGTDGRVKVWDLRSLQSAQASFRTYHAATTLSFSQRGMLAIGWGPHVEVWTDVRQGPQSQQQEDKKRTRLPYMSHLVPGSQVYDVHFVPYEDVLGIGHAKGVSSILIPGSGEPNFDTFEANPFETPKQRREALVHSLLEKLRPEMITLDPDSIGQVDQAPKEVLDKERQEAIDAAQAAHPVKEKHKTRGKNKLARRLKKKQKNVIAEKREARADEHQRLKEEHALKKQQEIEMKKEQETQGVVPAALDRFKK
jgi:U3 small nucleolar RNA-associated protein 7